MTGKNVQTVAVLGASDNRDRYSNKAVRMLKRYGHRVIPVHPRLEAVEGVPVVHALKDIEEKVDTLTMYVGELRSTALVDDILGLGPGRVVFNPGSENAVLEPKLESEGIEIVKGCTLVMLNSGTF